MLVGLRGMGQVPFRPPSVGGWPAGGAWLTTAAAAARLSAGPGAGRRGRPGDGRQDVDQEPYGGDPPAARRRRLLRPDRRRHRRGRRPAGRRRRPGRGLPRVRRLPLKEAAVNQIDPRPTARAPGCTPSPAAVSSPSPGWPPPAPSPSAPPGSTGPTWSRRRSVRRWIPSAGVLVMVTLYGGNDGLNTVVPAADPAYASARAELAYRPDEVLDLGEGLGLNPGHDRAARALGQPASWPCCAGSATRSRTAATSGRWPSGRPARPTTAATTGLAGTLAGRHHHRPAAGACRWTP